MIKFLKYLTRLPFYIIGFPWTIVALYYWAFHDLVWKEAWFKSCKVMNSRPNFG